MNLMFTLSMPSVGSWNGRWSGADRVYCVVKTFTNTIKNRDKLNKLLDGGPYRYDFGDGWAASISVLEVTAGTKQVMRKKSNGFCGYEWMIDSILECGRIRAVAYDENHKRSGWFESGGRFVPLEKEMAHVEL